MTAELSSTTQGVPSVHDGGAAEVNALAVELGRVARALEAEDDLDAMLDDLVATAVQMIPGADSGSVSLVTRRGHISSEHSTGDLSARLDALQAELGQGPCLDAVWQEQTVRVTDLRHEQRWPDFTRRALELGAGSMVSFQLFVEGDNLGALTLSSHEAGAFDDDSEHVGLLFASHAAIAYVAGRTSDNLTSALASRDLIGQAKGILMERYDLDAQQAFRVLTRASQNSHRKLSDVAAELTVSKQLPGLVEPGRC